MLSISLNFLKNHKILAKNWKIWKRKFLPIKQSLNEWKSDEKEQMEEIIAIASTVNE